MINNLTEVREYLSDLEGYMGDDVIPPSRISARELAECIEVIRRILKRYYPNSEEWKRFRQRAEG